MDLNSWTRPVDHFSSLASTWPSDALLMAESAREVVLARAGDATASSDDEAATARRWRHGHCFTDDWHVRWRRLGDAVRVVAAGPAPVPDAWDQPDRTRTLTDTETESREIVIWGRRQPGEDFWLELRIPNLMSPPKQQPANHASELSDEYVRRCLHVVTYRDPASARVLYHRYAGLTYARTGDDDQVFEPLEDELAT